MKKEPNSYPTHAFSMIALYCLAASVSMGVALVSISKLLVLIAIVAKLVCLWRADRLQWVKSPYWTFTAAAAGVTWLAISLLWTEASPSESLANLGRHVRLLMLPAAYFLVESRRDALRVLAVIAISQFLVVCCSWLMWLGVHMPFAKTLYPDSLGVVFSSTLEQPVMSTLMLILVWFLREEIPLAWRKFVLAVTLTLTIANVFFVMTGRTGYLTMLGAISLAIFWQLPKKFRFGVALTPVVLALVFGLISPRFQARVLEVKHDVMLYQQSKNTDTSQGQRLDYWARSITAIGEAPVLGHGVGSWRTNYIKNGGGEKVNPPSNPHQQFLHWAVEGGLVGFILILAVFIALYRDSRLLATRPGQALQATLVVTFLMGMANCPLFGAGIGEFILLVFAALLAVKPWAAKPTPSVPQ